jgi:hypothetical protein
MTPLRSTRVTEFLFLQLLVVHVIGGFAFTIHTTRNAPTFNSRSHNNKRIGQCAQQIYY